MKTILVIISCLISTLCTALDADILQKRADIRIAALYHKASLKPKACMTEKVDWYSSQFLGRPYLLGALGEGSQAYYDQFPLYRTDAFDCDTFVSTVLALASSDSLDSFKKKLTTIRYAQGRVTYLYRNHFTSIDWNVNNQKNGLLNDITLKITPLALISKTPINKSNWYAYKTITSIRLEHSDKVESLKRLKSLHEKGSHLPLSLSTIAYLPFSALFPKGKPNTQIFSQIPQGAVIEIIRPNWDLQKTLGTDLDVSHLGFAIWKQKQLYFRQASSKHRKVVDVPLIEYLKNSQKSPTIRGINVQKVKGC